jgi:alkyl sulfatase BDS1-like metallo-beta-lactamase superfamily hydrolase
MSLTEGERGVVVVGPLVPTECARETPALYRARRGDRPVRVVVSTRFVADLERFNTGIERRQGLWPR